MVIIKRFAEKKRISVKSHDRISLKRLPCRGSFLFFRINTGNDKFIGYGSLPETGPLPVGRQKDLFLLPCLMLTNDRYPGIISDNSYRRRWKGI